MIYGFKKLLLQFLLRVRILQIGLRSYRNPFQAFKALKKLIDFRRSINGNKMNRIVKSNGRYFFALNIPGWPSKAFDHCIENELNNAYPFRSKNGYLLTMIFAITKQCPLQCEHCYEWKTLNDKDILSLEDLHLITHRFQDRGVGQIQFSGGEPLQRIDDLISVIQKARKETDFWILTSGYGLTLDKTRKLKDAGLTGVNISLDHWDSEAHNTFRGLPNSFQEVLKAAENVKKADLVLSLTLCATKIFTSKTNLWKYAKVAKSLGAGFVQILEPRAVGHYEQKDIELTTAQQAIIEKFFLDINRKKKYSRYPTFMYPAYHQRQGGCFGSGDKYLYVDADGDIHSCPFCQKKSGNCISGSIEKSIVEMKLKGCHKYKMRRLL